MPISIDPNDIDPDNNSYEGTSNVMAISQQEDENKHSVIGLDDGRFENYSSILPNYLDGNNTIRIGTTVENIVGILHSTNNGYRLLTLDILNPRFSQNFMYEARPNVPALNNTDITIASYNLQNFFNGDGRGAGFSTSRGATTFEEYIRQRTKLVSALASMNTDIIGLVEIEDDGVDALSSIQDLVNGINTYLGNNVYSIIDDSELSRCDNVKNAILYKPTVITPMGPASSLNSCMISRHPVTQNFSLNSDTSKHIVISVNHFRSKAFCDDTGDDSDQLDGQGCFNARRKEQAKSLIAYLDTNYPNDNVLVLGDLNSFLQEDPIDIFRAHGFENIMNDNLTFVYNGASGTLDYALMKFRDTDLVADATTWSINYREPKALDYSNDNQAELYDAGPYRSSDHDPILVGLEFVSRPAEIISFEVSLLNDTSALLVWKIASKINNSNLVVEHSTDGEHFSEIGIVSSSIPLSENCYLFIDTAIEKINYYRIKQVDLTNTAYYSEIRFLSCPILSEDQIILVSNIITTDLEILLVDVNLEEIDYRLINQLGQIIVTGEFRSPHELIDVSSLQPGIYYMQFVGIPNERVKRFIKY